MTLLESIIRIFQKTSGFNFGELKFAKTELKFTKVGLAKDRGIKQTKPNP
jgi:hypothetical protein